MKQNIELYIEELVLDGFATSDREAIAAAVQAELTSLLQGGVPGGWQGGAINLDAGSFSVQPKQNAATTGQQIAQAIYGGTDADTNSGK